MSSELNLPSEVEMSLDVEDVAVEIPDDDDLNCFENQILEDESNLTDFDGFLTIESVKRKQCVDVKKKRGVISTIKDEKIIHSMKYLEEFLETDEKFPELNYENTLFTPSLEGTLLRMFYYDVAKRWYVSTQKKLNAYISYWGNCDEDKKSFGEIFEEALLATNTSLEELCDTLDKNKVYVFNLLSTEYTRIVSDVPSEGSPLVYHIGTYDWGCESPNLLKEYPVQNVEKIRELKFSSEKELRENLSNSNPKEIQGYIAITEDNRLIKFTSKKYKELFDVRGNTPSVIDRYISVRNDKEMVEKLFYLYPKFVKDFEYCEMIIEDIAKKLHEIYLKRYLQKQKIYTHPDIHRALKEAHELYFSNKERTTVETFLELLKKKTHSFMLKTLVKYQLEN